MGMVIYCALSREKCGSFVCYAVGWFGGLSGTCLGVNSLVKYVWVVIFPSVLIWYLWLSLWSLFFLLTIAYYTVCMMYSSSLNVCMQRTQTHKSKVSSCR